MNRGAIATVAAVAALALAAGGCGGDDDGSSDASGSSSPAEPEFGANVIRVPGQSSTDVAGAAVLAAYPPEEDAVPSGWLIYPREDWRRAVLSAQFVPEPVNAALLPGETDYLPTAADDLVSRIRPKGFPNGPDLQALFLGEPGEDVVIAFQNQEQNMTRLAQADTAELAAELVPYRGGWAEKFSDDILIVSSEDEDRPYGLIAGAWSGFTGDSVAFVDRDGVPAATQALLEQRQQLRLVQPTIYIVGPDSAVPESVASELASFGAVKRIPGDDPVETAVEFARYRDEETGFGWGLTKGPVNLSLVNIEDWGNAAGAFQLAGSGPKAAMLFTDTADTLPDPVRDYLSELKGFEPSQGYVMGDENSIASAQLAELDELLAEQ